MWGRPAPHPVTSSSLPLSRSSAVMKVQRSSSSFSFLILFSYKACMLKSIQEKNQIKSKKKKPLIQNRKKQQHGPYRVTTCQLYSLIIQETWLHVNMPLWNGSAASTAWSCAAD